MMALPSPAPVDLVCAALRQPQRLAALTLAGWDALVRQARCAGLLARIGCMLDAQGSLDRVPNAPRAHLHAAMTLAEFHRAQVMRDLAFVHEALARTRIEPLLLGGAAYAAADLLPVMGRAFTDIDIMVPEGRLAETEAALLARGWVRGPLVPHSPRQCVLVVRQGRLDHAHVLENDKRFAVLDPVGMVLHGMVHLFSGADLSNALRDLSDLDLLIRHCSRAPGFWAELNQRSGEPDLRRPLRLGLRHTNALLGTPMPPESLNAAGARGTGLLPSKLSDEVWTRALRSRHATASDRWTPLALFALQVRARRWRRQSALLVHRRPIVESMLIKADVGSIRFV